MANCFPAARMWRRISCTACATFAALLTILSRSALPQEHLPSHMETPGQIERRFQPPPTPKATFEPLFVPGRANLPLQEAAKITFTVTRVVVENSTVYTEHELRPLYEPYLNRQISLADAYQLADAITAKYRHDGHLLAQAIVPDQTMSDGPLTIE